MSSNNHIDPKVKSKLGLDVLSDKEAIKLIRDKKKFACKPCWELKYCPYGPLVEQFPTLPFTVAQSLEHQRNYKQFIASGMFGNEPLTKERAEDYEKMIANFNPADYAQEIHPEIEEMRCTVFNHLCPVFYCAEPFAETATVRRRGRYIPFNIKMRVVRRDNYTCQSCGKHLLDNEVEFDHIIPISKGGSTEEHNLRLTCFDCNRDKNNKVEL